GRSSPLGSLHHSVGAGLQTRPTRTLVTSRSPWPLLPIPLDGRALEQSAVDERSSVLDYCRSPEARYVRRARALKVLSLTCTSSLCTLPSSVVGTKPRRY